MSAGEKEGNNKEVVVGWEKSMCEAVGLGEFDSGEEEEE